MTRQMVHAKQTRASQTSARQTKGRLEPAFVSRGCRRWRASVARGCRTAPSETIVHTNLDGMLVLPTPDAHDIDRAGGDRRAAKVVVLVLGLGRPARREHVFEAGADGVAVLAVAGGCKALRHAGDVDAEAAVTPGVTALGVDQRRTPSVADAAGHGPELVGVGRHLRPQRERDTVVVGRQPGILGLDTHHPVGRELVVEATLHAAHEAGIAGLEAAVTGEGAADMAADIETGPVVDQLRRRIDGVPWCRCAAECRPLRPARPAQAG